MSVLRASIEPPSLGDWPSLPLESWQDTCDTLHMWMEVVGKVQLALTPKVNHWWNVTLYVTARGLASQSMRYGDRLFDIEFDFISHQLAIHMDDGRTRLLELTARPVADFYKEFMGSLHSLGIEVKIWPMPVEFPSPIRFDQDLTHASYDPEFALRFWRILVSVDAVLKEFRAGFIGKCSPVHFFWGSFDLCVTRFSGRRAPEREGADAVTREAYSHEVISAGFWPGSGNIAGPAFYAYAAPQPKGFDQSSVRPAAAFYDRQLGEFILMYDEVRTAALPRTALLEFLQSTYEAGANLAGWERKALET